MTSQKTRAGAQPSLMAASLPAYSPGVRLVWDGERDMVAPSHRLVEERTQIAGRCSRAARSGGSRSGPLDRCPGAGLGTLRTVLVAVTRL